MKKISLFTLLAIILCFSMGISAMPVDLATDEEYTITEPHIFTIGPGTDEWESYDSIFQRVEACRVSEEELQHMTTEALYETVLNYPLLINMYAYDSIDEGIARMSKYFGGIDELFSRPDALDVIREKNIAVQNTDTEESRIKSIYAEQLLCYGEHLANQADV